MRSLPAFTTIALSSVVAGAAVIDQLSAASLVITRTPLLPSLPECLISSYLGAFGGSTGQEHIYRPDTACAASTGAFDDLDAVTLIPLPSGEDGRVLWVGQAGVGPTWKESDGYDDLMKSWETTSSRAWKLISGVDQAQDVFSQAGTEVILHHTEPIMLLHTSNSSLLLHVPGSFLPIIDTLLPPHLVPVALPAITSGGAGFEAVPSHLTKHLLDLTAKLQFSPQIDRIITEGIVLDDIRRHVRWLTGEAPSGIVSRHSFTPGAIKTAHWLKCTCRNLPGDLADYRSSSAKVEVTGAACSLEPFLYGFAPNVICHYPSLQNSSERIILSSHYDSRGSFGIPRAPGGNDDGSGSGHLLGVAEAIGSQGVEFEKQVTLVFFSGEEQGLLGSHAYAGELATNSFKVISTWDRIPPRPRRHCAIAPLGGSGRVP